MNILVIEDEARIAKFLSTILANAGHCVQCLSTFEDASAAASQAPHQFNPHLVILDRLLQQQDAIGLIAGFKAVFPNISVLVLSAISSAEEKAFALDKGADDYMDKPFSSIELLARVRALQRRDSRRETASFSQMGNLILDITKRIATVNGTRLLLSNKEFLLLELMVRNPGRVFAKNELLEKVWQMDAHYESNVVESTINSVRRKLEDAVADIKVRNTRNVGYWTEA